MNIREVRKKIKSVGNVKKITNAMELISTIKMKKAQQAAVEARPYQHSLEEIINELTAKTNPTLSPLLNVSDAKKEVTIVISTNKGMCGAYNFNLFRFIVKNCDLASTDFIVIGKKAALFLNRLGAKILADFSGPNPVIDASAVFKIVLEGFLKREYGKVNVIYNQYISTLLSQPSKIQLLPIVYQAPNVEMEVKLKEYAIEPSAKELVDQLLRSFVEEKIRNCIIQAEAGEHSSRMIAMKNATDNAEHVIYNLTLLRNKIRQEKITYELLDMMTAKESVEN